MNTLTPHQNKALNIEKSISLTANAGSGKTFVLAQRFIHIILSTDTPLNKIAAITFTEKAASELYKRISMELDKLLLLSEQSELRKKIEKFRKQLVSAKISTIHSFCIDLLKEFPVEASLDANFITINEHKASELIDLSIESTLRDMLHQQENQSDAKQLIRLLGSNSKLAAELSELIQKRNTVLSLVEKNYSTNEKEIANHLFEMFKTKIEVLFVDKIDKTFKSIKNINDAVLHLNPKNESANKIRIELKRIKPQSELIGNINLLKSWSEILVTENGQIRKLGYLPSKSREGLEDSISIVEEFYSQLNEIDLTYDNKIVEKELVKYILALRNVFKNVLNTYEGKKTEQGVLDFEDILLLAKNLLSNETVGKALSDKYRYLLVDEYQDTNEIQYRIFLQLLDNLKKGNLFVVGDEKQSIYGFRDADLQVFSKTKYEIEQIYGEDSLLTLPDSFRMAPCICLFVNSVFQNLFKKPAELFNEVPATDLVCACSDDFPGKVEILISDNEEGFESELIVKKIIQLKIQNADRIKKWNNIAVLVRKRASFKALQKAFIRFNVPFNLIGGTGFYQKQSISDIYNYFAFLLNNKNDASLIGTLRSPFFLVSDVKILELSEFEGESYWEKIEKAACNGNDFWQKIYSLIKENKTLSSRINIPLLLRKILSESNFISVISSRNDRIQEISNLNKLVSITTDFFTEEFRSLFDYVTFLKHSIEGTEDEAQGRVDSGTVGVNIMTIHQAKGLEFPAVFLYQCNDTSYQKKVKAKSFIVDKDFGILSKVPLNENYFSDYKPVPLAGLYNIFEEKKDLAELKRLLYVGLTRAKDFLFISFTENEKSSPKNSFIGFLKEGLHNDFSKDEVILSGGLTFLQKEMDSYGNTVKNVEVKIPVTRSIDLGEYNLSDEVAKPENLAFNLSAICDKSKGEVISATRFSTFSSCPKKYDLLYNYKIGDLIEQSKYFTREYYSSLPEEYSKNELESYLLDDKNEIMDYSKIKGELIHYTLRKNIQKENLNTFIESRLRKYFPKQLPTSFLEEIINDLRNFYDSDEYKWINAFPDYRNEFGIYLKERDYNLFGIIDKLIIAENKLIIIDYKTDNIKEKDIDLKAGKYLPQLKFYAYIVSRLFRKIQTIEGRIIFIKHPDKSYKFVYNEKDDINIRSGINKMITSIRNNNFVLNLNECSNCIFDNKNATCISLS